MKPVSPAELTGAMQSAFVANQQLIAAEAAADEAQLRKARAAFYVNLFGMADAITAARQSEGAAELDPQLQQLATILRQQLAADPRRLEALKVFGARWMDFPKRTTDGVVVSGTVESTQQVGPLFHTKARLGNGVDAPVVTIVSSTDPQLASGDTVVALGSIIDQPAQKIAGYQGNDPSVVWSGMAMKVPATN
jgi:putative intracellular protease/amidase